MDLIPRVQCRKCGTEYSVLQSRCPKCGTRKVKQTQRMPGTTAGTVSGTYASDQAQANAKWQMTFAAILVVAVILAMIVLISTSLHTEPGAGKTTPVPIVSESPDATPTPTPTPMPTPTPTITSLTIKFNGSQVTEFTSPSGNQVQLTAEAYPLLENGQQAEVTWTSSNEAVCTVDENGLVTGQGGSGAATVTATCYGMTATCTVYSR